MSGSKHAPPEVSFRPIDDGDLPLLRRLYASTREDELYLLMLNRGNMLLTMAQSSSSGEFFFGKAEQPPKNPPVLGFVHGEKSRRALGEHLGKAGDLKALGGNKKKVQIPAKIPRQSLPLLGAAHSRMDALGAKAEAF